MRKKKINIYQKNMEKSRLGTQSAQKTLNRRGLKKLFMEKIETMKGLSIDQVWIKYGSSLDQVWIKDGSRMDQV